MAKNRHRIVVASRRYLLAVISCPFLTIIRRNLANFGLTQSRPVFLQGHKALSPIVPSPGLNTEVVIEIAQMHGGGFAEGHLCGDLAIGVGANALPMLFQKFCQLSFRYAVMRSFERLPNFFAADKNPSIIPPGLMTNEVLEPRCLPRFGCFFRFH